METSVQIIEIPALRYVPELIAWAIGITLAVIMVRWGGLKAENLLLVGCVLMLLAPLTSLMSHGWLLAQTREGERSIAEIMQHPAWIILNVSMALFSLGGLVCLIWAFLARFRTKKPEAA